MTIRVAVAVCSTGHTIFGLRLKDGALTDDECIVLAQAAVEVAVSQRMVNPWCEICRNRNWHYVIRRYNSESEYQKSQASEAQLRAMTVGSPLPQFSADELLQAAEQHIRKFKHSRN
jgi:hypothetical protein